MSGAPRLQSVYKGPLETVERLYVGMSRATDLLVVVGDPDVVREVGGEQVAKRLGI